MRKRISKEKDAALAAPPRPQPAPTPPRHPPTPQLTLQLLQRRPDCLAEVREFEKARIDRIVRGAGLESVRFQEMEKNCSFEEFLRRTYEWTDIRSCFTEIIHRNALTGSLTFVDFKRSNFRIMRNHAHQLQLLTYCNAKSDSRLTASRSTTEPPHFKQMELSVKRITKHPHPHPHRRHTPNASASFLNLLAKNIEKMIRHHKDSSLLDDRLPPHSPTRLPDLHLSQHQRLHTTPETIPFDSYGLAAFKERSQKRQGDPRKDKPLPERSQAARFQTEYDTEHIMVRKPKGKTSSKGRLCSKGKGALLKGLSKKK